MADDQQQPLFGAPVASPQALALRRALAAKQIEQGNEYSPLISKWQGLARVSNAIMGNIQAGQLDRQEMEMRKQLFEDAVKARNGGDPAEMLKLGLNPFVPERLAGELVSKSFPAQLNTGLTTQPTSQITGQPVGQPIPMQRIEQQSYGPGGVSGPTVVEPNAPSRPLTQAPRAGGPVNMPNTAAPGVQVPAGFNAVNNQPRYSGTLTPEALTKKGLELADQYSRQQNVLDLKKEDFQRGSSAQQRRQVYQVLNDAYASGGVSGGPIGQKILEGKQLLNQVLGLNLEGLPESEIIKKTSGKLAQEAAAGLRGTNMEFSAALGRSPGLEMSNTGSRYMLHILGQENNRDEKWALTGQGIAPENYASERSKFYNSNPITSPFTGKPLDAKNSEEDMQRLRGETGARTPQLPGANGQGWSIRPRGQ